MGEEQGGNGVRRQWGQTATFDNYRQGEPCWVPHVLDVTECQLSIVDPIGAFLAGSSQSAAIR